MSPPPSRIYLDNAATSWPKPPAVYDAVDRYQREIGAAAGRGAYQEARQAGTLVAQARQRVAALVGTSDPRQIVFGLNGTDLLNLALHGLLRAGDRVVTTVAEHNSILRPLEFLRTRLGLTIRKIGCDEHGVVLLDEAADAIERGTRLVACTHASNVTGAVQPIDELTELAHARGALVLLDAAQSLGHWPLDLRRTPIDLLAAPGHKGLLGPLGTGVLYVAPEVAAQLDSTRQGGTGSRSESEAQPDELPDKYEAGNLNVAGLAGLAAGLEYVAGRSVEALQQHEQALTARLLAGLGAIPRVVIHGPGDPRRQVGVVSLSLPGLDPQELAAILDAPYGVCVRAGLHCAPRMHDRLGTTARGGTLRLSVGAFNTLEQIDAAVAAIAEIAAGA